jgi:hypothetical protein
MKRWLFGFALALGALSAPAQVASRSSRKAAVADRTVPLITPAATAAFRLASPDGHSNGELPAYSATMANAFVRSCGGTPVPVIQGD